MSLALTLAALACHLVAVGAFDTLMVTYWRDGQYDLALFDAVLAGVNCVAVAFNVQSIWVHWRLRRERAALETVLRQIRATRPRTGADSGQDGQDGGQT